jgi:hypothetical protein
MVPSKRSQSSKKVKHSTSTQAQRSSVKCTCMHLCTMLATTQGSFTAPQWRMSCPMIGENRQLVTNEPVEFEKQPVGVQGRRKITDHFRGIYRMYPNLVKENRRMSTWYIPAGLANTRISTDYAQKYPRSLAMPPITLFRFTTLLCGADNIPQKILEHMRNMRAYSVEDCQWIWNYVMPLYHGGLLVLSACWSGGGLR